MKVLIRILVLTVISSIGIKAAVHPVISEFLAVNESSIVDDEGTALPWIEIHNSNSSKSIDLRNYHLTNDRDNLKKWRLPESELNVFATGKERRSVKFAGWRAAEI